MSKKFFSKIVYSSCNEDSNSERKALNLGKDDIVLCITASGARPLDLLVDNPKKIISIDFNPTQNYLLELKITCYKKLSYQDFLGFIGITRTTKEERLTIYKTILKDDISIPAQRFWDNNTLLITKGIIYVGSWDKILLLFSKILSIRKKIMKKMFSSPSLKEQSHIWENEWNNFFWKSIIKFSSSKILWKYVFREPGVKFIPKDFNIYKYMKKKFDILGKDHLLRENHMAALFFLGKYSSIGPLPIHLQKKNYEIIKERVHNIEIHTQSLFDVVQDENTMGQVTALSLSDFGSYCNDKDYYNIWGIISKNAKKGTTFCERQFLVKRNPKSIVQNIKRNEDIENELQVNDSTVFYTFISGIIT